MSMSFKTILAAPAIGLCILLTAQPQTASQQEGNSDALKIIRKSGGVLQETATRRVTPAYPPLAKAARVSGAVVIEVTIDEEGDVMSARAVSGHPLLKDSAIAAARGWKFKPTTLSGQPVKVIGTITFNYTLPSEEEIEKDIERYKEEVIVNPDSFDAHLKLGIAYQKIRRYAEAAETLEKAISINPQSPKAHHALGEAYFRLGHQEDSIEQFREVIRLDPDYIESYLYLGTIYQGMRDEDALEIYKQAFYRNPKPQYSEIIQNAIGFINFKLARYQEALDAFKQAIAINPQSGARDSGYGGHMGLCETYIKLGNKAAALAEYEILKISNQPFADRLLEEINKMP